MRKIFTVISLLIPLLAIAQASPQQAPSEAVTADTPSSGTSRAMPLRYEIWVTLDPARKMLHGRETIRWTNTTRDTVPDIWFHLYWNAFKNEKSAMMREARKEGLGEDSHGDFDVRDGNWGWIDVESIRLQGGGDLTPAMEFMAPDEPRHPDDRTVMRLKLPRPLAPGKAVGLELAFKAKVPRTIRRSGYYHNGYFLGQWFPKPGVYEEGQGWNCHSYHLNSEFFADFADFTVHITVPRGYVVGAAGREIARSDDPQAGTTTHTFLQERIHDFAWTADPDYIRLERDFIAAREVSEKEYLEVAGALRLPLEQVRLPDVKMILLINPEHRGQVERHFQALRMALKYYGLWYGPYPYPQVTMVDPPFRSGSGGMEYQTLFTAGTQVLPTPQANLPEMVIVHEFGHGYWYGLSASNEFEEAWLDEGLNTYSTGKVLAKAYGPGSVPFTLAGIPLTRYCGSFKYSDLELDRMAAVHASRLDPVVAASWRFASSVSYGMNVYMRAATNLRTMENLIGKEAMLRVMRAFQTRFRFRHPRSRDFIATASEVSGRDLGWLFDELFFTANDWDYAVDSAVSREVRAARGVFDRGGRKAETSRRMARRQDREKKEKTYVTRVRVRRLGEARPGGGVRLKVLTVFEDGTRKVEGWDGQGRWTEFTYEGRSKVAYAQVDPETIFLIDRDLSNNSYVARAKSAGALRWSAKLQFWLQNLLQFASALI
ncbi:MAG: M1 family metallopeptidase [Candidatus Aminicenantes bacterium]|nr:M1 family metallopeptidase [Candidatus Aminicenantes bacterium]